MRQQLDSAVQSNPQIHWLRLGILVMSLTLWGCSSTPEEPALPTLEVFQDETGTEFQTALGSAQALPEVFPSDWYYPGADIHSSGTIQDDQGGIVSLLLLSSDTDQAILEYYQEQLWLDHWDLLSESVQDGITTLVFDYVGPDPERVLEQLVVQVGAVHETTATRDILLLWSWIAHSDLIDPEVDTLASFE